MRSSFVQRALTVPLALSPGMRWWRCAVCLVAAVCLSAGAAAAQDYSGEYVLLVDGHAILSVSLRQTPAGQLSGTVLAGGKTLPLAGSVRAGTAYMMSTAPDGSVMHWEALPQGQSLAIAMAPAGIDGRPDPALIQRHMLSRGRSQSGGVGAMSQQWIARISAVADAVASWCSSPLYASSDICVNSMQLLRKVAPALMVARFAAGGEASALLRALMSGPGAVAAGPILPQAPPGMDAGFFAPAQPEAGMYDELAHPPEAVQEPWPQPAQQAQTPVVEGAAVQAPPLAQTLLGGAQQPAGQASIAAGDYVMLHGATEILRVQFSSVGGGAVTGTLSLVGTHFPFTGSMNNGRLDFTTTSASGLVAQWQGHLVGDELIATLVTGSTTERYILQRRGMGWSEDVPVARAWREYLESRTISHSVAGGVAETLLHMCGGGVLLVETSATFDLSMPQAGAAATQPQRSMDRGSWRVVANGDLAALELVSSEGPVQVGVRRGDGDQIFIAEQPAYVRAAGGCR